MARINLGGHFGTHTALSGVSANTGVPTTSGNYYHTDRGSEYTGRVRCYVSYTGGLTAANLVLYGFGDGAFYAGPTTALAPASGNQFVDYTVGNGALFALATSGMTGTGTITVKVEQI